MTKAKVLDAPAPFQLTDWVRVRPSLRAREMDCADALGTLVVQYGGDQWEVALQDGRRMRLPAAMLERRP